MTQSPARDAARPAGRWNGPLRRVLVLDDDPLIVRAVTRTLRVAGLTAEGTTDAAEALDGARRHPPDVVVSDLHMPKSCGAVFLTAMADLVPSAMRVLMTADPDLRPKVGSLAEARLHALMTKSELPRLSGVIIEQLRARTAEPAGADQREALAFSVAHVLGRPAHEDDAHRERVLRWTSSVGAAMGLTDEELAHARLGAILHDVGQIALRDVLFTRRGSLTAAEREEIAGHPEAGVRIVSEMPALRDAMPVIRSHHERADGRGYPARAPAGTVPRGVRAFQVVDAYDAMTTGRAHSPPRPHRDALDALKAGAGAQHDPEAVRALDSLGEAALAAALSG